MTKKHANLKF